MTSIDDLPAVPSAQTPPDQEPGEAGRPAGVRPRGVLGKLPRYAAGKPPVVVE